MIVERVAGVYSLGPRATPARADPPATLRIEHAWTPLVIASPQRLPRRAGVRWPCLAAPDPGGILIARAFMRGAGGAGFWSITTAPQQRRCGPPAPGQGRHGSRDRSAVHHLHHRPPARPQPRRGAGDIDLATAPDLHTHLCAAIDAMISNAGGVVIVDLSAVTFMDASGLTALIRAEARACGRGCPPAPEGPGPVRHPAAAAHRAGPALRDVPYQNRRPVPGRPPAEGRQAGDAGAHPLNRCRQERGQWAAASRG
jgi:hypothetical protein